MKLNHLLLVLRIIRYIFIHCILFAVNIFIVFPSFATTYYISSSTGIDTNDGMTALTPWQTIAKVNSTTFLPGDNLLFRKGDIWKYGVTMNFSSSGTVGEPIVISSYGDGDKPVISGILPLTGWNTPSNWVNTSTNIWQISYPYNPRRLWLNTDEKLQAGILADVGIENSEGTFECWVYVPDLKLIYLYATSNPATQYSSIEINLLNEVMRITAVNNLIIDGIDFRGGSSQTICCDGCSYITLKNCNIGYGNNGLNLRSSNPALSTHHIVIEENTFDSGLNFFYGYRLGSTGESKRGSEDAIGMWDAVNNCIVRNNNFSGWGHSTISCKGTDSAKEGVYDNKIYGNYFNGANLSYGRPLDAAGLEGKCYNNEFYNNLMKDHSVRSQIAGNNNRVHHNIFDGQTNSTAIDSKLDGTGQAIWLAVNQSTFVCHDNEIDNNLFINTEEAAIVLRSWGFAEKVTNNYIRNNIFYNTGTNPKSTANSGTAIIINNNGEEYSNVFQNNNVFNPEKPLTNAIKYYSKFYNIEGFNGQNWNNANIIFNNIQMDPLFVDYYNSDFHLQTNSPCIDAGIVITELTNDFDGNPIYTGARPDIGAYEKKDALNTHAQLHANSFEVRVSPNPSSTNFKLSVQSNSTEIITIRLMDIFGKAINIIKTRRNESVTIGNGLRDGIYYAEVTQGSNNKGIKLIKINQQNASR